MSKSHTLAHTRLHNLDMWHAVIRLLFSNFEWWTYMIIFNLVVTKNITLLAENITLSLLRTQADHYKLLRTKCNHF